MPLQSRLKHLFHELTQIWRLTAFFLVCYLILLVVLKLLLERFDIQVLVLSKAFLGAAITGKVVVLLRHQPISRLHPRWPGILRILYRTGFFTVVVTFAALLERYLDRLIHHKHPLRALEFTFSQDGLPFLAGIVLMISLIFFVFSLLEEISEQLGPGRLQRLLFTPGQAAPR